MVVARRRQSPSAAVRRFFSEAVCSHLLVLLPIWKRLGQVCFLFEKRAITDDHQADIRGLVTAFACVRPELPQSTPRELEQMLISQAENEDSPTEAPLSNSSSAAP